MKKIFTYSLVAVFAVALLASCTKRDYYNDSYNEDGSVIWASNATPYSIISFSNGDYALFKTLESIDFWPYENDIINGNFETKGSRSFLNKNDNRRFNGLIIDFYSNLDNAYDDLVYYSNRDGYEVSALMKNNKISSRVRSNTSIPIIK